jgi:hypothetical protein
VNRLSRQCGILNISQPYKSPRPVTGTALLFYFYFYPNSLEYSRRCNSSVGRLDRASTRSSANVSGIHSYFLLPLSVGFKWFKVGHGGMNFAIRHQTRMNRAFLSEAQALQQTYHTLSRQGGLSRFTSHADKSVDLAL